MLALLVEEYAAGKADTKPKILLMKRPIDTRDDSLESIAVCKELTEKEASQVDPVDKLAHRTKGDHDCVAVSFRISTNRSDTDLGPLVVHACTTMMADSSCSLVLCMPPRPRLAVLLDHLETVVLRHEKPQSTGRAMAKAFDRLGNDCRSLFSRRSNSHRSY